jgi:murein DD-endopeptidase MepM/ murein hydrolase activator NlpD
MWGFHHSVIARLLAISLLGVALVITLNAAPAHALRAGSWSWPLAGPHTISRNYEAPSVFYGPGHRGIDLVAQPGQEVVAPADGVVHFVGTVVDRELISLGHGQYLSTFEPVTSTLVKGEKVLRGQVIGTVGISTHCTCLHMGARQGREYLSPLSFLAVIPPAVLLPWD